MNRFSSPIKIVMAIGGICAIELLVILLVSLANFFGPPIYYLFYNLGFGLVVCTALPLLCTIKNRRPLSALGFTRFRGRQLLVTVLFVAFSIGGQCIPILIEGTSLPWNLLKISFLPLVMTTFFEEILFRGFIQTGAERRLGPIPAVLLSALTFSLYHIGYPGFRNFGDLLLLFAVGLGFALAYKLADNNLAASYLVNLPNALLTYLLRHSQFPVFDDYTSLWAVLSILCIPLLFLWSFRRGNEKTM